MEKLPIEVWCHIFRSMKSTDVLNFCEALPEYKYLLECGYLIGNFNINNWTRYDLDLCQFIKNNVNYKIIRTLNINGLYWLNLNELRQLVKSMSKLEELHAMDTSLAFRQKDVELYSKLRVLSLTLNARDIRLDVNVCKNNMYLLKRFCVKIISKPKSIEPLYQLFEGLYGLRELWIEDADITSHLEPIDFDRVIRKMKFLEKFIVKATDAFLITKSHGMAKVFERKYGTINAAYYIKCPEEKRFSLKNSNLFEPYNAQVEQAWSIFRAVRCDTPYDIRAAEQIYLTREITNVRFRELNFTRQNCTHNGVYVDAMWDFVLSESAQNITKLTTTTCMFLAPQMKHTCRSYVKQLLNNCKRLKELQVFGCDKQCDCQNGSIFSVITAFTEVEKLTIKMNRCPKGYRLNAKYLKKVMQNLKSLKTLRLSFDYSDPAVDRNLINGLKHVNNTLEEFSFESDNSNIGFLLKHLNDINFAKLRSFSLKTDNREACFVFPLIKTFVERNAKLTFLHIICEATNKEIMKTQRLFSSYRKNHRQRLFYIKRSKDAEYMSSPPNIPDTYNLFNTLESDWAIVDFYQFE